MINVEGDAARETLASLLAEGWERFEGEPGDGFMVAEGPNGERLRMRFMDEERLRAMQERWMRQLTADEELTPYQQRKRRESEKRADARDRAMRESWQATYKVVRREAFRAIREGRDSNVLLFTPSAKHRHAGVQG